MNVPRDSSKKLQKLLKEREAAQTFVNRINQIWKRATEKYNEAIEKLAKINADIYALQHAPKEISFTDHALLRYVERVLKIDVEGIPGKILTKDVEKAIQTLGTAEIPTEEGYGLIVRDNKIITITTPEEAEKLEKKKPKKMREEGIGDEYEIEERNIQ